MSPYGHLAKDANVFEIVFPTWQAQEENRLGLGMAQGVEWEGEGRGLKEECPHPSLEEFACVGCVTCYVECVIMSPRTAMYAGIWLQRV